MSAAEGKLNHDTTPPNMFWVNVTVWGLVVFVVLVVIVGIGFYKTTKSNVYRTTESSYQPTELQALKATEAEDLQTLARDPRTGRIQLPIDMAMDAVVRQYQR